MDVTDIAGTYTAMVAQRTAADVSTAVLAKAMKTQASAATELLAAMPQLPQLPPFGSLGQNVDVRA